MSQKANNLINESSPYLLQHAYNPVNWYAWNSESLALAKKLDKPVIVSIGYSACHWCHVMERECFEDQDLASLMNEYFFCIKVDREERPDVDQIYMDALQNMGLQGGWPLNVFLTPDLNPFYGGTYFPPRAWAQILRGVNKAFTETRADLEESANGFTNSLQQSEVQKYGLQVQKSPFSKEKYISFFTKLAEKFDREFGGMDKAPKFPMPCIWTFLLDFYLKTKIEPALEQLELTLDEIAKGGIYDQIGGGFARYSVDGEWFVPHFEKMLYDNGQLLSLYSRAYSVFQKPMYKQVIEDTIAWLSREMLSKQGGLYSAIDADSEGEEGKFYVWTKQEIDQQFDTENAEKVKELYDIQENGNWEEGKNILRKRMPDEVFARKHNWSLQEFEIWQSDIKSQLLRKREEKIRPHLDDKLLAGWNGLALSGLSEAYLAAGNIESKNLAKSVAEFIARDLIKGNKLYRTIRNGEAVIPSFLEDYAAVIEGFIHYYQISFDSSYLSLAKELFDYSIQHFWHEDESFFYFAEDDNNSELIARKKEIFDNVIPASNSMMAHNLWKLGHIFGEESYLEKAQNMLSAISRLIETDPQYLANWASLYGITLEPMAEIAIIGPSAIEDAIALQKVYHPNRLVFATKEKSKLEIFENREAINGQTTFYVCFDKTCKLPVFNLTEANELLLQKN
jgi:uncharacterized protein YyaL (SSP411 family)